jgi:L-asparaginase / beta-aspartyl-peptidase
MPLALIVHGGAKEVKPEEEEANRLGCVRATEAGWRILDSGGGALEAVEAAIRVLEADPTYNAGYGSELNADGEVQMDASIMEGRNLGAGAVAFIQGVRHPISVAYKVLHSEEVFLAGDGAYRFAAEVGAELCSNSSLITAKKQKAWRNKKAEKANNTVGCVALDSQGLIAAGASTGGTGMNRRGRVGDTPQIGCGVYADCLCGGATMTGDGEQIARLVLAKMAVDRLADVSPDQAAFQCIHKLQTRTGGEAGCILIDKEGRIGWYHNSSHMPIAYCSSDLKEIRCYLSKPEERAEAA